MLTKHFRNFNILAGKEAKDENLLRVDSQTSCDFETKTVDFSEDDCRKARKNRKKFKKVRTH